MTKRRSTRKDNKDQQSIKLTSTIMEKLRRKKPLYVKEENPYMDVDLKDIQIEVHKNLTRGFTYVRNVKSLIRILKINEIDYD